MALNSMEFLEMLTIPRSSHESCNSFQLASSNYWWFTSLTFDPISSPFFPMKKDIDYEGFQKFLDLFLDCDTPRELSKHLFLSFLRPYQSQIAGNMTLSCMALASNTCMAPVTSHNTRGTFSFLYFFHWNKILIMFNDIKWAAQIVGGKLKNVRVTAAILKTQ